jgi:hypothetical protein
MKRRATEGSVVSPAPLAVTPSDTDGHSALAQRRAGPRSAEEAEERYIPARDTWIAAMRAANSGRAADLAALAVAQEAYEAASAERERWLNGRVSIPIQPERGTNGIDAVVGQEMAWRAVKHHEEPSGFLGRLRKRIRR